MGETLDEANCPPGTTQSVRECLLPAVECLRAIRGPDVFGTVTSQVTIRKRTWSGGRRKKGKASDEDLVLPQRYTVEELPSRDVTSSGGRYSPGDLRVVVTPAFDTGGGGEFDKGGFTVKQLAPLVPTGTEIIYVLEGGVSGDFKRVDIRSHKPFRYTLIIRRVADSPQQ